MISHLLIIFTAYWNVSTLSGFTLSYSNVQRHTPRSLGIPHSSSCHHVVVNNNNNNGNKSTGRCSNSCETILYAGSRANTSTIARRKTNNNINKKKSNNRGKRPSQKKENPKQQQQQPVLQRVEKTNEQILQMSIGQAIQESTSIEQLLILTGERMWIPTDENLPQHIRLQLVHHEKRFRSACLLLERLSDFMANAHGSESERTVLDAKLWTLSQFRRVVLAAALPFIQPSSLSTDDKSSNTYSSGIDVEKECRFVTITLVSLHTIAGFTLPPLTRQAQTNNPVTIDKDIIEAIQLLIQRAEGLSSTYELALNQAIEIRWAVRSLYQRIPHLIPPTESTSTTRTNYDNNHHVDSPQIFQMPSIPNLNRQVAKLPFDIIPCCIDWTRIQEDYKKLQTNIQNHQNTRTSSTNPNNSVHEDINEDKDIIKTFLNEIPFNTDTITTRSGSLVQERRSTAWIAENGIGSLAYSGKLMIPKPIPPIVQYVMREVEKAIIEHDDVMEKALLQSSSSVMTSMDYQTQLKLCLEENGRYFDCALTNHYPDYSSACKFHTDPEHGSFWERLTTVVSAGNDDIRKFAFRPIPQMNDWSQWECNDSNTKNNKLTKRVDGIEPAVIYLFPGDCVKMWGSCNDVFHHAVYGAVDDQQSSQKQNNNDGRVSLVFKKAMDRGNGRRGHGQRGEGRRTRRGGN